MIRVWNNEIDKNIAGVMENIYAEIYGSLNAERAPLRHLTQECSDGPTPARVARRPPPAGEGG